MEISGFSRGYYGNSFVNSNGAATIMGGNGSDYINAGNGGEKKMIYQVGRDAKMLTIVNVGTMDVLRLTGDSIVDLSATTANDCSWNRYATL